MPQGDPVCTPHGYLYNYEALLENMLEQKKEYKRALKEWKAQQDRGEGFVFFLFFFPFLFSLSTPAVRCQEGDGQAKGQGC